MTRNEFRALVEEAIDSIPERFAQHVRNVGYVIEDEPSEELLEAQGCEGDETLCGLYEGTPLTERESGFGNALPDRITLFQFPIEDCTDGTDDEVRIEIAKTLMHELGHYFGLDEDEMDVIEEMWEREQDSEDDA